MTLPSNYQEQLLDVLPALGCQEITWDPLFGAMGVIRLSGSPDTLVELRVVDAEVGGANPGAYIRFEYSVEVEDLGEGITELPAPIQLELRSAVDFTDGLIEARRALAKRVSGDFS